MLRYYDLIKKAKPKNKAKKIKFDENQNVFLASCNNYFGIEILGVPSGMLLMLSDGNTSLEDIVKAIASKVNVPKTNVEEVIVIEVRNLQKKHLLYFEV